MQRFVGKTALWFYGIVFFYHVCVVSSIFIIPQWNLFYLVWLLLLCSADLIFIPVIVRNYVEVYDTYFIFFYGFSKKKIDYREIQNMEEGIYWLASSANALHRIHIETKQDELYLALKDNKGFIEEIQKRKKRLL